MSDIINTPSTNDSVENPTKLVRSSNSIEEMLKDAYPYEYNAIEAVKTRTPLLNGTDVEKTRLEIREYFHKMYTLYEFLFKECLKDDSVYLMQGTPLRHPLIFYYGHTAAFFINKLIIAGVITERIDPHIEFTCAIGVDEMSWDDLNPAHYNWPTVAELDAYRVKVRKVVDDLIMNSELTLPITWDSPFWIIMMGIEHEKIHLETSSVLFRQLPIDVINPAPSFPLCPHTTTPANVLEASIQEETKRVQELLASKQNIINNIDITKVEELVPLQVPELSTFIVPDNSQWKVSNELHALASKVKLPSLKPVIGGDLTLGKTMTDPLYGWDNEYGKLEVKVADFKASTTLITNQQYLLFMLSGGYTNSKYWTKEGWAFAQFRVQQNKPHPEFWVPVYEDDSKTCIRTFQYRSLCHVIDMPWDWPVDLNNLESKAVANWLKHTTGKSLRLLSEPEWYQLRKFCVNVWGGIADDTKVDLPYWDQAPGNINMEHWASSCPVNYFNFMNSGFYDVIGNVWQNCETSMLPYPGFQVHPAYDDFTVPTFDNLHSMIKGGSWISMGNEATVHSRYAFRRHFYQHAGCRIVESDIVLPDLEAEKVLTADDPVVCNNIYDHYYDLLTLTNKSLAHPLKLAQPYPVTLSEYCMNIFKAVNNTDNTPTINNILVSGCSTGRGVFTLAKLTNTKVTGLDFTTRIILPGVELSSTLKSTIGFQFLLPEEGSLNTFLKLQLDSAYPLCNDISSVADKVEFIQGDVCNLAHNKFVMYDLIVFNNIDTIPFPQRAIENLVQHLNPNGIIIVPYTGNWNKDITREENWLGGYKHTGNAETIYVKDGIINAFAQQNCTVCTNVPEEYTSITMPCRQTKRAYLTYMKDILVFRKQ